MRAKDKTISSQCWFSSLSPFSYSIDSGTFWVIYRWVIYGCLYIEAAGKLILYPVLCSFMIVNSLIIQKFRFCIMSWLVSNQVKPSPFWNSKLTFLSFKCLVIANQKLFAFSLLCLMWAENPFNSTDIFVLVYNLLFLKQWTPAIQWFGNVKLNRNNSDYRDQSYWLIFQKFHPDPDMLTIKKAKNKQQKRNWFLKWGVLLVSNCKLNKNMLFLLYFHLFILSLASIIYTYK